MRNHLNWLFLLIFGIALVGCQDDINVNSPINQQEGSGFGLNKISPALEDLTTDLKVSGSNILTAGVGTLNPGTEGTGTVSITVPSGVTVKNVFLYWESRHKAPSVLELTGDPEITVNGTSITGELIGKSNQGGFSKSYCYRKEVTDKGWVSAGSTSILNITNFQYTAVDIDRPDGVSVLVVIDDGSVSTLEIRDGNDFAYLYAADPNPEVKVTKAQTFTFASSTVDRTAELKLLIGNIGFQKGSIRPHRMDITVGAGPTQQFSDPFQNNSGPQWDNYSKSINIPAGVTQFTVQLFSVDEGELDAASFAWLLASLKVPTQPKGKLGDRVWKDQDCDGIQDDNEIGIAGVKVELYNCAIPPVKLAETTTDNNGYYFFSDLVPGTYSVKFYAPSGYSFTAQRVGTDKSKDSNADQATGFDLCNTLDPGEVDLNIDAGLCPPQLGKLGDRVWKDLNCDGIQDDGEPGVANLKVELYNCAVPPVKLAETTTDANGYYLFTDLTPGSYSIKFYAPSGFTFTAQGVGGDLYKDSNADPLTGFTTCTTVDPGEDDRSKDAGLCEEECLNKIGDFVWHDKNVNGIQDNGEPGIAGVKVELLVGTTVIASTTTNVNGKYEFTGLSKVNYCVRVAASNYESGGVLFSTAQTKWYATKKNQGTDDSKDNDAGKNESVCVDLNCTVDLTLDFGFYKTCVSVTKTADKQTAKPGEYIIYTFIVENCGDITLSGGVDLFDKMLNPVSPYKIANITPVYPGATKSITQKYCVKQDDCGDLTNTVKAVGHPIDGSANVEFSASVTVKIECQILSKLGDKVWKDKDNDGIQDSDEDGIKGVKVELYKCTGQLIATQFTNDYGKYYFTNLSAGDYKLKFYTPSGYAFTKKDQGTNDSYDSDVDPATGYTTCITLGAGVTDLKWDAGLTWLTPAKLGNRVWKDKDKDGKKDNDEYGISNVVVKLYDCNGNYIKSTTTDYNGYYYFSNLPAGDYKVKFITPTGYVFTKKDQGSDDSKDSDADPTTGYTICTNLSPGEYDSSWDAGFYWKSYTYFK
jgi:hypothetical protein